MISTDATEPAGTVACYKHACSQGKSVGGDDQSLQALRQHAAVEPPLMDVQCGAVATGWAHTV